MLLPVFGEPASGAPSFGACGACGAFGARFKTLELCNAAWGISKMSLKAEQAMQASSAEREISPRGRKAHGRAGFFSVWCGWGGGD